MTYPNVVSIYSVVDWMDFKASFNDAYLQEREIIISGTVQCNSDNILLMVGTRMLNDLT